MPLKFSSEKHSALFQPVHFEKLIQLWMIHDESNTFSNHDWKQNGAADARQGIKTIIPYLCKPWSTSQLIKALVLAPWPTNTCAKSLFLPTYSGTANTPWAKGQRITVFRQQQEPHTPVECQRHSWTKLVYLGHQQLQSPVSEQIKTPP